MSTDLTEQREPPTNRIRFRLRSLLIFVAIASVLLVPITFLVHGISTSLHAERTLHAINLVTYVTVTFVEREKRWPTLWDDLCSVRLNKKWGGYTWPADVERVKPLIAVDFDTDLETVSKQTVEQFVAISPTGAYYPFKDDGYVKRLIEAARAAKSQQSTPPAP